MIKPTEMSNVSKDTRSMQPKIHRFSQIYSQFLIRFSWLILIVSFAVTVGLTICFLCLMRVRSFDQTDFLLAHGRVAKNIHRLQTIFGNDKNFRVHQQMDLYPAVDVIIRRKPSGNMLDEQIINEIHRLDQQIRTLRINHSRPLNYSSLCAMINRACSVDGNYLLSEKFRQDAPNLPVIPSGIYLDSSDGANGISSFIFSKNFQVANETPSVLDYEDDEGEEEEEDSPIPMPVKQIVSYVPIFRLRYSLNVSTSEMRDLALLWERDILRYLNEEFRSNLISLSVSSSTAISDTVSKQARDEGPFLAIMLVIFFICICVFLSIQGNFQTSVGYLSVWGIVSFVLSTGATFGLLTVFRIQLIEPMTLIVFAVAIIDCMRMSITCGEYHRIIKEHLPRSSSTTKIDIEKVLPLIIESSYPQTFASLIILTIVYLILALISPISCIKLFCLTLILYLVVNCITHCTLFGSCLVITLKRIQSRRHCLFFYQLPQDYSLRTRRKSLTKTFLQKRKKFLTTISNQYKKLVAGFGCLLALAFVAVCIWLVLSIDTRLFDDRFLPKEAKSLRSYMKSQMEDYDIGPMIMFTIPEVIDYRDGKTQLAIRRLVERCHGEKTTNNFTLLWLDQEDIHDLLTSKDPVQLRITPFSQNDLIISEGKNQSRIEASRFYCQYRSIKGDRDDLRTMNNMYSYARESELPSIFPYSLVFPHYESLEQIRIEICLILLMLVIISFVVILLVSFSFRKAVLTFVHMSALLSGTFACLYLFHHLTFNFADALWLYLTPIIYLETVVHASSNKNKRSKWKYNRALLALFLSLIIFLFFPIETYIFHVIYASLIYETVLCFLLINFVLPSWSYIIRTIFKKKPRNHLPTPINLDSQPSSSAAAPENQNLVQESN